MRLFQRFGLENAVTQRGSPDTSPRLIRQKQVLLAAALGRQSLQIQISDGKYTNVRRSALSAT